jgi:hypothetical protein
MMWNLSSEPSIWIEIWEYLLFTYIDPELPYFNNLSNRMEAWSIVLIIAAVFVGIMASGVAFVLYKSVLGNLPRQLLARGAVSEETAVTPKELGLRMHLLLRLSLRRPTSALRRYVRYVGEPRRTYQEQLAHEKSKSKERSVEPDFRFVPIYLVEEKSEECLHRFSTNGSNGKSIAILISIMTVLFFVVCRFLPEILSLFDSMLGIYS